MEGEDLWLHDDGKAEAALPPVALLTQPTQIVDQSAQTLTPGERLRRLRFEKGLRVLDLAKKLGCTGSSISRAERGLKPLGELMGRRYAEFFEKDIKEILS